MKTMTCAQLGGPEACAQEFHADSFEQMGELSKHHAMEMMKNGDEAHIKKMEEMKMKAATPGAVEEWMSKRKKEFDELPEN